MQQHTDRKSVFASLYPTVDRMFVSANAGGVEDIGGGVPAAKFLKPYFLSHYTFEGNVWACSGTFKLFNSESNPYVGVLIRDTPIGKASTYRITGKHYLPVHTSATETKTESTSWNGKVAWLIVEGTEWGVVADPMGKAAIAIGRIQEGYHFRPNGIKWGDRFVKVELDPSLATINKPVTEVAATSDSCCFGDCKVTAYPEVVSRHGLAITVDVNAFAVNPIYAISKIEWCYTGATEIITLPDGSTFTRPKADHKGLDHRRVLRFKEYGDHTVTLRITLAKDGSCGCGCGDEGCCITKTLLVNASLTSATICIDSNGSGEVGVGTVVLNDWICTATYKDLNILTIDKVVGIVTSSGTYTFATSIDANDSAGLSAAITAVLATGPTPTVSVTYAGASVDGANSTLEVTVTGTDATLVSLQMVNDGATPNVYPFVALP